MPVRLNGMTFAELGEWVARDLNEKPFRARQLFKWLHFRRVGSFSEMTDLSKKLRSSLEEKASITVPVERDIARAPDGTVKYLLQFPGGPAEAVLIPDITRIATLISELVSKN